MTSENYTCFVYGWIALAVIIFFVLMFVTAPYGRHTKKTWGPAYRQQTWMDADGNFCAVGAFLVCVYGAKSAIIYQSAHHLIFCISLFQPKYHLSVKT